MTQSFIFVDQMGTTVHLPGLPRRIVSLVPSQTELLYDLGLDSEVIGITKYCVHPAEWLTRKTIVGGTKSFDATTIAQLRPDLVIGNKEENVKEGIELLSQKFPVWMSDIVTLEDALTMIGCIGGMVGRSEKAEQIINSVRKSFEALHTFPQRRTLYLIWRKPWMAAGRSTFINDMLSRLGLSNCLPDASRYPQLSSDDLQSLNPELILLSSEPYPFREKHIGEIQTLLPHTKIILVDGEMFSWYGSRLLKASAYFEKLQLA